MRYKITGIQHLIYGVPGLSQVFPRPLDEKLAGDRQALDGRDFAFESVYPVIAREFTPWALVRQQRSDPWQPYHVNGPKSDLSGYDVHPVYFKSRDAAVHASDGLNNERARHRQWWLKGMMMFGELEGAVRLTTYQFKPVLHLNHAHRYQGSGYRVGDTVIVNTTLELTISHVLKNGDIRLMPHFNSAIPTRDHWRVAAVEEPAIHYSVMEMLS